MSNHHKQDSSKPISIELPKTEPPRNSSSTDLDKKDIGKKGPSSKPPSRRGSVSESARPLQHQKEEKSESADTQQSKGEETREKDQQQKEHGKNGESSEQIKEKDSETKSSSEYTAGSNSASRKRLAVPPYIQEDFLELRGSERSIRMRPKIPPRRPFDSPEKEAARSRSHMSSSSWQKNERENTCDHHRSCSGRSQEPEEPTERGGSKISPESNKRSNSNTRHPPHGLNRSSSPCEPPLNRDRETYETQRSTRASSSSRVEREFLPAKADPTPISCLSIPNLGNRPHWAMQNPQTATTTSSPSPTPNKQPVGSSAATTFSHRSPTRGTHRSTDVIDSTVYKGMFLRGASNTSTGCSSVTAPSDVLHHTHTTPPAPTTTAAAAGFFSPRGARGTADGPPMSGGTRGTFAEPQSHGQGPITGNEVPTPTPIVSSGEVAFLLSAITKLTAPKF